MSTGETGFRSVAARVIAEHQGALLLRRKDEGYEFTGLYERTNIVCKTWPEAERVLIRMKVPPHKIEAVINLIEAGNDVVIRSEVKSQDAPS
ncbi:MAG: hypothetical protein JSS95_13720 [Acidobacteria bacterium]|nr:hypothetical protein [Acidobacteriota bacterium]